MKRVMREVLPTEGGKLEGGVCSRSDSRHTGLLAEKDKFEFLQRVCVGAHILRHLVARLLESGGLGGDVPLPLAVTRLLVRGRKFKRGIMDGRSNGLLENVV